MGNGRLFAANTAGKQALLATLTTVQTLVGLTDLEDEGSYVWSDGAVASQAQLSGPESLFNKNEPNNDGNIEDCVVLSGGSFNDIPCYNYRYAYACEIPLD